MDQPRHTEESRVAVVEIRTTVGSREAADEIADRLVATGLAACVQVEGPIRSVYRWRGNVETSLEWRCVCKTSVGRAAACVHAIRERHAYELPEVLMVEATADQAYAAWVRQSVGEPDSWPGMRGPSTGR